MTHSSEAVAEQPQESIPDLAPRQSRWQWLRYLWRDKKAFVGVLILLIMAFFAIFAPYVAPYDPTAQEYGFLTPPSRAHPLGTDDLSRDLLSRLIYGARVSLLIGFSTVALSLVIGVLLGLLAGYYGGWLDFLIMRYIDLQWAFPNFIIAVYLVALFGTGLVNVIVAITLAYLDDFSRIVRGVVLSLREEEYMLAARSMGASDTRILWRHALPNTVAYIIVQATVAVAYAILAEATLSFLGLGVQPTTPTWGLILSDARSFISRAWWLAIFPGLCITLTVLSLNFVGDTLRDIFDVREYQEQG